MKNYKNTESFCLSILNYLHKWLVHLNLNVFTVAMLIFFLGMMKAGWLGYM